jgi:hypothetical protein
LRAFQVGEGPVVTHLVSARIRSGSSLSSSRYAGGT